MKPTLGTRAGEYRVRAVVKSGGATFDRGYQVIEYPHIRRQHIYEAATATIKVIDVNTLPNLTIGYVMGVGDQVPPAIEQLGAKVEFISADDLAWGNLSRFDAIVTGVRAYERRGDLRANNSRLLEYVNNGGTLIVQYNKFEFNEAQYGPYPAKVSNDRVTDEHAPVKVLNENSPLLNAPNRINDETWNGWVQERGLYFLDADHDSRYKDLLEIADPFENNKGVKKGALVETQYGKGRWVYVGLGLWRELPAGVDGVVSAAREPRQPRQDLGDAVAVGRSAIDRAGKVKPFARWTAVAAAVACCGLLARAAEDPVESGQFTLFKFEQAIGEERYEVRSDGDLLALTSTFSFTDRGTPVQLSTSAQFDRTLKPAHFAVKGETARITGIDAEVTIAGANATIREGRETRRAPVPEGAFTLAGYAPASMQMELMRYWASHGRPSSVPLLPQGAAQIERRGRDEFVVDGRMVAFDRYSVSGVVWGRETVWVDENGRLAALVGVDAEFDHFEAVRPELEAAVPQLVARAASDGMAAMAETAAAISPAPSHAIAITGGTILDMTARTPIVGTVVVVDGRITAVGPSGRVAVPPGATIVNAAGKTVMPGLWDMHAHFEQVEWGPIYLAAGVTTIRDVGNELEFIVAARDAVAAGKGIGPRMLLAGIIDGPGSNGLGAVRAATPEEARQRVDRYHDAGFTQIKIYSSVSLGVLRAITAEAHRLGMTVTGHVPEGMNAFTAIDAGLDQINHAQYLTAVADSDPEPLIAALRTAQDRYRSDACAVRTAGEADNAADRVVRAWDQEGGARARDAARRIRIVARGRSDASPAVRGRGRAHRQASSRRYSDRRRHGSVRARP